MSTKKLDRTAIEGGRRTGYKYERKQSLRANRRSVHAIMDYHRDPDDFYDVDFPERKKSSYWSGEKFNDRLGAVKRWMKSKVGQPWDKVYSLMREMFDVRTTPGRHIMFDHMLGMVWTHQDRSTLHAKFSEYYVDAQGILRENPEYKNRFFPKVNWNLIKEEQKQIDFWLAGRLIGKIGDVLYWFEPVRKIPANLVLSWSHNEFYYIYVSRDRWIIWETSYRQGNRLEGKSVEFFSKLTDHNKNILLKQSPLFKTYYDPDQE